MDLSWLFGLLLIGIPALFALGVVLALTFVKSHRWLWVAGATSTAMGYTLPIAGIFPSINLLAGLASLKGLAAAPLWRTTWMRAAAAMALLQLLSSMWSPQPVAGVREFVYLLPFFLLSGAAYQYGRNRPQGLIKLYGVVLWLSAVQALLIIAFRVAPSAEARFITSPLAGLFISPNVIASLFDGSPNNIFDAAKSGGLFVNANTAAAFAGCCAMLAWYFGRTLRRVDLQLLAALHLTAVFFTGSKAGAICAVVVPATLALIHAARGQRPSMGQLAVGCLVAACAAVLLPIAWELYSQSGFTRASTETLDVRQRIWSFAWGMFKKHPLGGLGHGGWELHFPFYAIAQGLNPNYPPHNMFMLLWSKAGLGAVLAGLLFSLSFILAQLRLAWRAQGELANMPLGVLAAFLWVFIQAQGENFGILGEPHITTMLALAAGGVAALMTTARLVNKGSP
jgi:O-antigen ligase